MSTPQIRASIRGVLGIVGVDLDIPAGVSEIRGLNAQGKTSIATVLAAMASHEANPAGVPVTVSYRHDDAGDDAGVAHLEVDGVDVVEWSVAGRMGGAEVHAGQHAPISVPEAAGLVDFTARISGRARAALLQPVLLPDPAAVLDKLRADLAAYLPESDVAGCVAEIEARGWEAAETVYTERGRAAKRAWCKATGAQRYGVSLAADWRPVDWVSRLDGLTAEDAERELEAARAARDELLHEAAISEAAALAREEARLALPHVEHAETEAAQAEMAASDAHGTARQAAEMAAGEWRRLTAAANAAAEALAQAREGGPGASGQYVCPQCGADLVVADGALLTHEPPDDEAAARWTAECEAAAEAAQTAAVEARDRYQAADAAALTAAGVLGERVGDAARARETCARTREAASIEGVQDSEDRRRKRSEADAVVTEAQRAVTAIRSVEDAQRQRDTVEHYSAIARALGPSGVRAGMIAKRLARLVGGARKLCETAGWPDVAITEGGLITAGGRAVALCSESERWRVQAVLQLSIAALTGSRLVVLDRADLLDDVGRAGLGAVATLAAEKTAGLSVVLCATPQLRDMETPVLWPVTWIGAGRVLDPETGEIKT